MRGSRLDRILFLISPQLLLGKKVFVVSKRIVASDKMRLPAKIAIGGGVMFFFILIFGWVLFPKILTSKIKGQLTLKPKGEIREMYMKIPFPLVFKIFLFNVTNHLDVAKGDSPVLDQVGPFVFDEWKEKVDYMDNETDDTLTFRMKDTFIFNKELSGSLTMDEVVVVPHPMIVGLVMYVANSKPSMLSLLSKAINVIFENPETPFVTTTVYDLLFGGVVINCTTNDFAGKAVCTQLKTEATDLVHVSETVFKFSLFGPRNGTAGKKYKVKRGIKVSHDLGRVIEYDEKKEMEVWPTKECNQYKGTDGTIFPPFLSIEEGLVSFAPDLCRSLKAEYNSPAIYDGIPCNKYTASLGDMSTDPSMKCFCPAPDKCLKRGVMDLTSCSKVPIIVSLPHFYDADSQYVEGVRGIHPREEDHGIVILFEAMSGSPLSAKKRLQFNFPLAPIEKIKCMKDTPDVILPFFWVEEGVDLNSTFTGQLKNQLLRTLKIVKIAKWLILVVSLLVTVVAGFYQFKGTNTVSITPIRNIQQVVEKEKNNVISMINSNGSQNGNEKF